jgi:hypothetical protein
MTKIAGSGSESGYCICYFTRGQVENILKKIYSKSYSTLSNNILKLPELFSPADFMNKQNIFEGRRQTLLFLYCP